MSLASSSTTVGQSNASMSSGVVARQTGESGAGDAGAGQSGVVRPPAMPRRPGPATPSQQVGPLGFPVWAWVMAGVIGALFVALYWPNLRRLWLKTNLINGESDWAHAMFVPVLSVYYLFVYREELRQQPVKPLVGNDFSTTRFALSAATMAAGLAFYFGGPVLLGSEFGGLLKFGGMAFMLLAIVTAMLDWGLGTLLCGLALSAYGIYPGQNDYVKDVGMVMTLFGVVLTLCGWKVMKVAWFPVVFLICALPWPGLFYSRVAMPLQELAATGAVTTMNVFGVSAVRDGTQIVFPIPGSIRPRILNVHEACAGLKSLMMFVSLGAITAFLSNRALWQKLIVVASAVPIAILCNVIRVSMQGLLDYYVDQRWSSGFAHAFSGMVMLIPGFFMIYGVGALLDALFVDVIDDDPEEDSPKTGVKSPEVVASKPGLTS